MVITVEQRPLLTCLRTSLGTLDDLNSSVAFKIGIFPLDSSSQHKNKSPKYLISVSVKFRSSIIKYNQDFIGSHTVLLIYSKIGNKNIHYLLM